MTARIKLVTPWHDDLMVLTESGQLYLLSWTKFGGWRYDKLPGPTEDGE